MTAREDTPTALQPAAAAREAPRALWDPPRHLLKSIRDYQDGRGTLGRKVAVLRHRFWSAVTSCDVPINTRIGTGLSLPHATGIVIHAQAEIGENCLIMQNVTIGTRGPKSGVPTIGRGVDIGPGAVLLGPITVGDGAQIGANAVVVSDVPPFATAVGVPARLLAPKGARAEAAATAATPD